MKRRSITASALALVAVLIAGDASGQSPSVKPFVIDGVLQDTVLSVPGLAYVDASHDWNGDGLLDLTVGDHDGSITVFLRKAGDAVQLESGFFATLDGERISFDLNAASRWIDVDADGLEDLVVSSRTGVLYWLKNIGQNGETQLTKGGLFSYDRVVNEPFKSYAENIMKAFGYVPHAGFFPIVVADDLRADVLPDAWAAYAIPDFVDWNEDGLFDLFVGTGPGVILIYLNVGEVGNPRFGQPQRIELFPGQHLAPRFVDADQDGKFDLLIGVRLANGSSSLFIIRQHEGESTFPTISIDTLEPMGISNIGYGVPDAGYWDGDAKIDLIRNSLEGEVLIYENKSLTGAFSHASDFNEPYILLDDGGDMHIGFGPHFNIADMNDDGLFDIIHFSGSIYYNQGSVGQPVFTTREPFYDSGRAWITRTADWNGDGKTDLMAVANDGIRLWINEGTLAQAAFPNVVDMPFPDTFPFKPSGIAAIDWNDDGDMDVVMGDMRGYVFILPGSSSAPSYFQEAFALEVGGAVFRTTYREGHGGRMNPVVVDWNEDGLFDLFLGDYEGVITYLQNEGGPGLPLFASWEYLRDSMDMQAWRDIFGFGMRRYYEGDFQREIENFDPGEIPRTLDVTRGSIPFLYDLDGDDVPELVLGQLYGRVFIMSPAAVFFEDVTQIAGIAHTGRSYGASWGDFDGDGSPDLWVGNHLDQPSLYLNDGNGAFTDVITQVWAGDPAADTHGAAWADADNDGDQDLIELVGAGGGVGQGANHFYANHLGSLVEMAVQLGVDYPLARARTPLWLDGDGDGLLDVILCNNARPDGEGATAVFRQVDGGFVDVSAAIGFELTKASQFCHLSDLSGDGWMDLVIAGGYPRGVLDLGGIPLVDLLPELSGLPVPGVQDVATADFNGDLKIDLFLTGPAKGSDVVQPSDSTLEFRLVVEGEEQGIDFSTVGLVSFEMYKGGDPVAQVPQVAATVPWIFIGSGGLHPPASTFTLSSDDPSAWGIMDHVPGVDEGVFIGYEPASQIWKVRLSGRTKKWTNAVIDAQSPIDGLVPVGFSVFEPYVPARLLLGIEGGFTDVTTSAGL